MSMPSDTPPDTPQAMASDTPSEPPTDAAASRSAESSAPKKQAKNPLHGLTLEAIVTDLLAYYGWAGLYRQVPLKCFASDPSIKSTLVLLRRTPWAREKIESLYLFMNREKARQATKTR